MSGDRAGAGGGARRLAALFEERTGRRPDGVWAAPGRVNVIGEHTDYNDGFVLPVAIDRRVHAAVGRRQDGRIRCWSAQEGAAPELSLSEPAAVAGAGWAAYAAGMALVLAEAGVPVAGFDLVVDSDVPVGAGLSSSAALEAAVGLALVDLHDAGLGPTALALAAWRAEREVVGVPVGVMDQMAVVLGRAGTALFLDTRSLESEALPFDLDAAGLRLVVVDTRVARRLVEGAYAERRRACEEAARRLGVAALRDATPADVDAARDPLGDELWRRARHVVTENARVLAVADRLRAGDVGSIGPMLAASHESLRSDFEVSSAELDVAVAAATAAGAVGARMTGAGFGGCALA
ncbi:MAG: galactokinase, partial [Actinomycetota bacterium]|nr:galactokinase [Actinomycetota bacterium]